MEILSNSPIQSINETIYLNDAAYQGDLFFSDTATKLYYIVVRKEVDTYKVVASGLMNAYNTGYRFNFDSYIKINTQDVPVFGATFSGYNSSDIYLAIDIVDVYAHNVTAGHITQLTNGEAILNAPPEYDLLCKNLFSYKFIDAESDATYCRFPSTNTIIKGNYYPITLINSYTLSYSINGGTPVVVNKNTSYDYTVAMIYIPDNCSNLKIDIKNGEIVIYTITLYPICGNYTCWYFMNKQGAFDSLNCYGVNNEIDTITKEQTKIGNKAVVTDISIVKQIKQNSGFRLMPTQIYSLISSPYVYRIVDNKFKEYTIDNTTFEGYNGLLTSGKNIEFIFTDPYQYKRKSNRTITFYD